MLSMADTQILVMEVFITRPMPFQVAKRPRSMSIHGKKRSGSSKGASSSVQLSAENFGMKAGPIWTSIGVLVSQVSYLLDKRGVLNLNREESARIHQGRLLSRDCLDT